MGPDEQLQQNVRWRVEVRGAGMRQSAARQQREILHRGEEEIDHLQHQCKYPKIKFISSFLSLSFSLFSFLPTDSLVRSVLELVYVKRLYY